MTFQQGAILGSLIAGFLCGLIPTIVAFSRGRSQLAVIAMVACVIAGFLLGLIAAVPVAIGFTIAALVNPLPQNR
jgi:phosphotransferase system  glucose/maltose/N-acetylglucosamine-specific IIC component